MFPFILHFSDALGVVNFVSCLPLLVVLSDRASSDDLGPSLLDAEVLKTTMLNWLHMYFLTFKE